MALDRAGHDPDLILTGKADHRGSEAEAPAGRDGPAEARSREEYYAVLTAEIGATSADGDHRPGTDQPEPSGWDAIDAENRPPPDAIRITPERGTHILDGNKGDNHGGGHRHGTGKPGKTEFPASWDDEKILDTLLDVARRPDRTPRHQDWNGHWVTRGTRDDVEVVAIVASDGRVWSGWPLPGGPGVVKNPKEG